MEVALGQEVKARTESSRPQHTSREERNQCRVSIQRLSAICLSVCLPVCLAVCLGTHSEYQSGLRLTEILLPLPPFQVLGSQANWAAMVGFLCSYTIQGLRPGNGTSHFEVSPPTSINTVRQSPTDTPEAMLLPSTVTQRLTSRVIFQGV